MNRPSPEILIRFFRGDCPPEEEEAIRIYLAMNVDHNYLEECLRKAFPDLKRERGLSMDRIAVDGAWHKLNKELRIKEEIRIQTHLRIFKYVAAVILLLGVGGILFTYMNEGRKNSPPEQLIWQETKVSPGKIKRVNLPDGSSITLFPGSTVQIASDFNKASRRIKLAGKAFFDIAKRADKPFLVSTESLDIMVLGTSFEVDASAQSDENVVILHTGKVSVSANGKKIATLMPEEQLQYHLSTAISKIKKINLVKASTWLKGELIYEQAPLKTILRDLSLWYGKDIQVIDPSVLHHKITIDIKDLALTDVINMLSKSASFTYTIKQDQILIKERRE